MVMKQKPRLSRSLLIEYQLIANFKVDFHHVYIYARHDLMKKWKMLSFLVIEDDIMQLVLKWLTH